MKMTYVVALTLGFFAFNAHAAIADESKVAVCEITAQYPEIPAETKDVTVKLSDSGYRNGLVGVAKFGMNKDTIPGSISINSWSGHAGQVVENELSLGGFDLQKVGMNFELKSDGSSIKVSCLIK